MSEETSVLIVLFGLTILYGAGMFLLGSRRAFKSRRAEWIEQGHRDAWEFQKEADRGLRDRVRHMRRNRG